MSRTRVPILLVLAAVIAGAGVLSSLARSSNPASYGSGNFAAESTALYCTGLTDHQGVANGHVVFENTTDVARSVSLRVASDANSFWTGSLELAAHSKQSISPSTLVTGHNFGVAAQVGGAGVKGEVVTASGQAATACLSQGVTKWYATGFDTVVGSKAFLSIENPTATPSVFSISIFGSGGFSAPAPFQGLAVRPHGELVVNLGDQIVNTVNVGVYVNVLRGTLALTGVQSSGGTVSLVPGTTAPASHAWFPSVTTVNGATAQLRVANPNQTPVTVSVKVQLANFSAPAPQQLDLAPYATGVITITPNPAIAPDAYAALALSASQGVVTNLALGNGSSTQLSGAAAPARTLTLEDFSGQGFDAVRVTNVSALPAPVSIHVLDNGSGSPEPHFTTIIGGGITVSLKSLISTITSWKNVVVQVSARKTVLVAGLTLRTRPAGILAVAPLDGG
ncbi:MAG TPA: DUF5719 family protein [Acidimicrobiales bacterium]|nr:DUF5719 family protein [Acidimicrobiales bacterium]